MTFFNIRAPVNPRAERRRLNDAEVRVGLYLFTIYKSSAEMVFLLSGASGA